MDNTSFLQSKMKFDRETFGGLADMFGQMPGTFWCWPYPVTFMFQQMDMAECPLTLPTCVLLGCGIGTGPGVIQDHYSPTMGRHRTNQHYSDHVVNGSNLHQAQFDSGNKPFIKQNQVEKRCIKCFIQCFLFGEMHNESYSQGQNSPVFNHKQNHLVQMQSKDMAPRFGKKGKVNADEVQRFALPTKNWSLIYLSGLK